MKQCYVVVEAGGDCGERWTDPIVVVQDHKFAEQVAAGVLLAAELDQQLGELLELIWKSCEAEVPVIPVPRPEPVPKLPKGVKKIDAPPELLKRMDEIRVVNELRSKEYWEKAGQRYSLIREKSGERFKALGYSQEIVDHYLDQIVSFHKIDEDNMPSCYITTLDLI